MSKSKPEPLDGWLLYITNHFTHPVHEARGASPRHHLARKLGEFGQKMIVFCPLGRRVGNPLTDFLVNLFPKRTVNGNVVYLFPPVLVSPASGTTPITLLMATAFITVYLSVSRMKVVAQYCTTVLVGCCGAFLKSAKGIPLVANYGDPDFAREKGLAKIAFSFCETFVLTRNRSYAVIYVDEVIGRYLQSRFAAKKLVFLPNGGYEAGHVPEPESSDEVQTLRRSLGLVGRSVVIYAGHVSKNYRLDILVPSSKQVLAERPDAAFLIIGEGQYLPELVRQANEAGVGNDFRFVGTIPYESMDPYLAMSKIGLQLLNDMCMGTKVLMYMANGVAVISAGAWYDLYRDFLRNGENAMLIPPDEAKLRDAILGLLKDPATKAALAEEGKKTVEPFTWDRHATDTLSLLREASHKTG